MKRGFEQERQFYRVNHARLSKKYSGETIMIKGTQVLGVVNDLDERIAMQNAGEVYLIDVTPEAPVYRYGVYVLDERPTSLPAEYTH